MSQLINVAFSSALVHFHLPDWIEYGLRLCTFEIVHYTRFLALLLAFADVYTVYIKIFLAIGELRLVLLENRLLYMICVLFSI